MTIGGENGVNGKEGEKDESEQPTTAKLGEIAKEAAAAMETFNLMVCLFPYFYLFIPYKRKKVH